MPLARERRFEPEVQRVVLGVVLCWVHEDLSQRIASCVGVSFLLQQLCYEPEVRRAVLALMDCLGPQEPGR